MDNTGMTARICAFSRAYHSEHNNVKIFDDTLAKKMLSEDEYNEISANMSNGILYFNPHFSGNKDEALRWIVDNRLSQTPLARAAFAENALENAVFLGAKQYLIFGAGYDTFSYRRPDWAKDLTIFEIDRPDLLSAKQKRLVDSMIAIPDNVYYIASDLASDNIADNTINKLRECKAFDANKTSFCSMLGLTYYLSETEFDKLLHTINELLPVNSSIVFDYPGKDYFKSEAQHADLADAANETMRASYSYSKMERLLEKHNFLIFEHLTPDEMTSQYFKRYNQANPDHPMKAQENVNYCLCVKK